jgi:hypothetical protein
MGFLGLIDRRPLTFTKVILWEDPVTFSGMSSLLSASLAAAELNAIQNLVEWQATVPE